MGGAYNKIVGVDKVRDDASVYNNLGPSHCYCFELPQSLPDSVEDFTRRAVHGFFGFGVLYSTQGTKSTNSCTCRQDMVYQSS